MITVSKDTILNQTGKRKARILLVDDDPGLLRLLTIRLRAESYDVEAVESAAQALSASSRFRPDLVITDLRDRKSTRLNSSHSRISYAVFCLKKKKKNKYARATAA